MNIRYIIATITVFFGMACAVNAQEFKQTERTTLFGVGLIERLDVYLSPRKYKGEEGRFISSVLKKNNSTLWDKQFTHEGSIDITHNDADNVNTIAGHYNFAFAMMHRWELADGKLNLRFGGMTEAYVGFAYNTRKSANNPAQAYLSASIGIQGMATYNLKIGKCTYPITYEARLPLIGAMFSPAYGQSYYEIFNRGNYDNNIVCFAVDLPSVRQQVTIGIPTGKTTSMVVGYIGDIRQAEPNSLLQHTFTNAVVIGMTKHF